MLEIKKLKVVYGKETALNIQSPIKIESGERIGIIGSNGAGKTTMINALLNLVPYTGNVKMNFSTEQIGVHQQNNNYTDNLSIAQVIYTVTGAKYNADQRLTELVDYFKFKDSLRKKFKHLSGGQKQRLTLIMVLYQDKELVFFDEVTSGLDYETRQQLVELLSTWYRDKQTTICYVSHYYEELEQLADKILLLEKGEIVCFGDKRKLFEKYCGKGIYILNKNEKSLELFKDFKTLAAPEHLLVISSNDIETDKEIVKRLIAENLNYKYSNNDIEIMSFNALTKFKAQKNYTEQEVK